MVVRQFFLNSIKLNKGDEYSILYQDGMKKNFIVTEKRVVNLDKFPLQEVFGETKLTRLNLITCGGNWDKQKKEYSERTVVFSELKSL